MSIRTRLTLWYAATLSASLGLFGGLLFFSLQHLLLTEADLELEGTATRFQSYFISQAGVETWRALPGELQEFCEALPPSTSIQIIGPGGFAFRYTRNGRLDDPGMRFVRRQFTFRGSTFTLEAKASAMAARHALALLRTLLLSLTPLAILAASLSGAWLSRRALQPVNDITAAARIISIENLSQRLPVLSTGDEIARLGDVLNSMFDRLESAVVTLSQFVADASHELRTPIAVVRTTAELALRRPRTPDSYRGSLEQIVAEAERMTKLVEDLLALARSDARTAEMPLTPIDVRDVLDNVCLEMAALAAFRRIEIGIEKGLAPQVVAANPPAIHRLFLVLLDNAVKYSKPGGQVSVRVGRIGDEIRVSVADSGYGIETAELAHIFKRFYRADPARTGAGHGLGLALAKSIALAHRASIEVNSRMGVGSVFQVIFPAR